MDTKRRSLSRLVLQGACVALLVNIPAACDYDECNLGERRCSGDNLLICEDHSCHVPGCSSGLRWTVSRCEHTCAQAAEDVAFCALESSPDPMCGEREGYCEGNEVVHCQNGFVRHRGPCNEEQVCTPNDPAAPVCSLTGEPDPRCGVVSTTWPQTLFCDNDELVSCEGNFVTFRIECDYACASPPTTPGFVFCAAASEPDPRCESPPPEAELSCPGGEPAYCQEGFLACTEALDAGAGT